MAEETGYEEHEPLSLDPTQGCQLIGAFRAFHGIKDGYVVLHSPPDCHSGMLLLRTLCDNADARIAFSGIHPRDFIYGAEHKALIALKKIDETFKPAFIALLDACAPAIVGDDLDAVEVKAREDAGIKSKILFFTAAGFHKNMWMGYESALASLAKFMDNSSGKEDSVNLIGFKDDGFKSVADLTEIKRLLNGVGLNVNAVLTADEFKRIECAPKASLNIVLGGDGIKLARVMNKQFGIPYVVVDYPYGVSATERFLERICEGLEREVDESFISQERARVKEQIEKVQFYLHGFYGLSCAVIGDTAKGIALAKFLSAELGFDVKVLAITNKNFMLEENLKKISGLAQEIMVEPDRFEMERCIANAGVQMLFGSTFDKRLANIARIPLVRFSYPTIDSVALTDTPYAGFRGVSTWLESIVNSLVSRYYEVRGVEV
ncbi:nitrogenase [Methanophagales archaeon]|nr:MAG: nitrogenase [Methanophagales archaeon]